MEVSDIITIIIVSILALFIIGMGIWSKYITYKEEKEHRKMLSTLNNSYLSIYTKFLEEMRNRAEARLKELKDKEESKKNDKIEMNLFT